MHIYMHVKAEAKWTNRFQGILAAILKNVVPRNTVLKFSVRLKQDVECNGYIYKPNLLIQDKKLVSFPLS